MTTFWINNLSVLLDKNEILQLWPNNKMSMDEKLNAISRLIILLTIVGFLATQTLRILIIGLITLGVIVFLHFHKKKEKKKEHFTTINHTNKKPTLQLNNYYETTFKNPFSNVLLPEIQDNPRRKMAPPAFNKKVNDTINQTTKKMVQKTNPTNKNIDEKLFRDLGDNYNFDKSLINFNSNPSTTIPNDQKGFAEFCYGDMSSCKDKNIDCTNNPQRIGAVYN
jgi:hypothetical protein